MRKITVITLICILWAWSSVAQITIGPKDGNTNILPIYGLWNYSYSQQLVYSNEINGSGDITSITFSFESGNGVEFNDDWEIYLGHTNKTSFESNYDWVVYSDLTQVYAGSVTFPEPGGLMHVVLDIPYTYNGDENLVIAIKENKEGYGILHFGKRETGLDSNRAMYFFDDYNNPNPSNPPIAKGRVDHINNIILGGIQEGNCLSPTYLTVNNVTNNSLDLNWVENGEATSWEIEYGELGFQLGTGSVATTDTNIYTLNIPTEEEYDFYVRSLCGANTNSAWAGPFSFSYCRAASTSVSVYIKEVSSTGALTDVFYENTSPYEFYYADKTDQVFEAYEEQSFGMFIDLNKKVNKVSVWVDWNRDRVFDEDEIIASQLTSTFSHTIPITIPSDTPEGDYRMRVRVASGTTPKILPCGYSINGFVVDFKLSIVAEPSCKIPDEVISANATPTTIDLDWTERNNATSWNIEYGETGFVLGDGVMQTGLNVKPYTATGLTENTRYDFYVQSNCESDGLSNWAGPFSFKTSCIPASIPYLLDFDDAELPDLPVCTSQEILDQGEGWLTVANNLHGMSGYVLEFASDKEPIDTWLYTQGIELEAGVNYEISFKCFGSSFGKESMKLAYGQFANETAMTNELADYQRLVGLSEKKIYFDVASDGVYYFGFHAYSEENDFINLDDIKIKEGPSCLPPSELYRSDVSLTSVDVGWLENNNATSWNIEYGELGFAQGSGTMNIGVTSNPYTLTSLTPGTDYEFYVQSNCGNNEFSDWEGPYSFRTICESTSLPYLLDFEDVRNTNLPPCTSQQNLGEGNNWIISSHGIPANVENNMNGKTLRYETSNNQANVWFYTQGIQLEADRVYQISYKYYGSSIKTERMKIAYGTQPEAIEMTNELADHAKISGFGEEVIYFSPAEDSVYYFGIHAYSEPAEYILLIDDIEIKEAPSCLVPSDLSFTYSTESSVELLWTENGDATSWQIEYGPLGFEQNTGTVIPVASNPYNLEGLEANTEYEFYVRSVCNIDDMSNWSKASAFKTQHVSTTIPYILNFDDSPLHELPEHTSQESLEGISKWRISGAPPTSMTGNALYCYRHDSDPNVWFYTQGLELETGLDYEISFKYKTNSNWAENLRIVYGAAPEHAEMTSEVVNFVALGGTGEEVVNFSVEEDGVYYLGFHAYSEISGQLYIDDLEVKEVMHCLPPSDLYFDTNSATSLSLSWLENGSALAWDIEYGPIGFELGSGTTVSVTSNPYSLNIPTDQGYHFYIRSSCNDDNKSDWNGPVSYGYCPAYSSIVSDYFSSITSQYAITNLLYEAESATSSQIDQTATVVEVHESQVFNLLTNYMGEANGMQSVGVWVDWNKDFVFDEVDELMAFEVNSSPAKTLSILVPEGISEGDYRMRIRGQYGRVTSPSPCGDDLWSATVDFTLNVSATPDCIAPSQVVEGNATYTSVELNWSQTGNATSSNLEYGEAGFIQGSGILVNEVSSNEFVLMDLNPGTHYEVYLQSDCDNDGLSAWSGPFSFSTLSECEKVTNISVTDITQATATINWIDTSTIMQDYIVTVYVEGANADTATAVFTQTLTEDTSSVEVSGLAENTSYDVYITSDCGSDVVVTADVITFTTEAIICNPVTDVTATNITETSVTISWTASNSATDGYMIEMHAVGADPSTTYSFPYFPDTENPNTIEITELFHDTEYEVYVISECGSAITVSSDAITFTTKIFYCDAVTDISATDITSTTATINWTAVPESDRNYDLGNYVQGYFVWVYLAGADRETADPVDVRYRSINTSVEVGELTEETAYDVYITTSCYYNSNISDAYTFTTEAYDCDMVTDVLITDVTDTTATINWTESVSAIDGYIVDVYEAGADTSTATAVFTESLIDGTSSIQVSGLVNDTSYDVYITSDCGFDTAVSDSVSFTTTALICEAVTDISVSNITEFTATVSWTVSTSAIDGYIVDVYEAGADTTTSTAVFTESLIDSASSIQVLGLINDTSYDVYITSNCGFDTVVAEVVTFTTEEIEILIEDVEVSDVTPTSAIISWSVPETTSYWYYTTYEDVTCVYVVNVYEADMNPDVDDPVFLETVAFGVNQVEVTGLTPDTDYVAYITLECSNGVVVVADNVTFSTEPTSGVTDHNVIDFKVYPNPVGTALNIHASKRIEKVEIYSILGQKVQTYKPNVAEITLDVTDLSTATYVLKIKINGVMHTVHFIKK